MAKENGYPEGIDTPTENLKTKVNTSSTPIIATSKNKETMEDESSPDYVLDVSSLKERAQKLIDSGQFSNDDLAFLHRVVNESTD